MAGLAETMTNSVKLKLELRLSLAKMFDDNDDANNEWKIIKKYKVHNTSPKFALLSESMTNSTNFFLFLQNQTFKDDAVEIGWFI